MAKQKFYVVWKGRAAGIFESWDECNVQIGGFPGAEYKSFKSRQLAEQAFRSSSSEWQTQNHNNDTFGLVAQIIKYLTFRIHPRRQTV